MRRSSWFSETVPDDRFFLDAADEAHPNPSSHRKGPEMANTTLTAAQVKLISEAVKKGIAEGIAEGIAKGRLTGAPPVTGSQSSDDSFRAAGAAYQNRGWNALAAHLHPEESQPPAAELVGPGDARNSRGWQEYGELLRAEAERKGKGRP